MSWTVPHTRSKQRALPRQRLAAPGRIFPGNLRCLIVDYSVAGAKVVLSNPVEAPEKLVLLNTRDGEAYQAEVRWRSEDSLGVVIAWTCDLRQDAPPAFAEAQAAWLSAEGAQA